MTVKMTQTKAKNISKSLVKMQEINGRYRVFVLDNSKEEWRCEGEFRNRSTASYELKEQQLKAFNKIMRSH